MYLTLCTCLAFWRSQIKQDSTKLDHDKTGIAGADARWTEVTGNNKIWADLSSMHRVHLEKAQQIYMHLLFYNLEHCSMSGVVTSLDSFFSQSKWLTLSSSSECFFKENTVRLHYLALALSLQVYDTHVNNRPQISERFHHCHVGALVIAVYVELRKNNINLMNNDEVLLTLTSFPPAGKYNFTDILKPVIESDNFYTAHFFQ